MGKTEMSVRRKTVRFKERNVQMDQVYIDTVHKIIMGHKKLKIVQYPYIHWHLQLDWKKDGRKTRDNWPSWETLPDRFG